MLIFSRFLKGVEPALGTSDESAKLARLATRADAPHGIQCQRTVHPSFMDAQLSLSPLTAFVLSCSTNGCVHLLSSSNQLQFNKMLMRCAQRMVEDALERYVLELLIQKVYCTSTRMVVALNRLCVLCVRNASMSLAAVSHSFEYLRNLSQVT